jgi:hypothetical protein
MICKLLKNRKGLFIGAAIMWMSWYLDLKMDQQASPASPNFQVEYDPYSRIAYLITIDAKSNRTKRSITILESVGFEVKLEFAPTVDPTTATRREMTVCNKLAQLSIFEQIVNAPNERDEWGCIFEDDIILNQDVDFSVAENLLPIETDSSMGIYLGICGPERVKSAQPHILDRYCGRCAHAFCLSRRGAAALLEYQKKKPDVAGKNTAMDLITEDFCNQEGGFPVIDYDKESNQIERHRGTFIQDRNTFKSIIS